MSQPEADILRRVIIAECQFAQASALQRALTAKPGSSSSLLMHDEMDEAARFSSFIEIFNVTASRPLDQHFMTAKLKPHNHHAIIESGTTEDN
jgi:hypothetical protein